MMRLLVLVPFLIGLTLNAQRALPQEVVNNVVLIQIGSGMGSGFYMAHGSNYFLVTARHVLFGKSEPPSLVSIAESLTATSYAGTNGSDTNTMHISLTTISTNKNVVYMRNRDIAALRIGRIGSPNSNSVTFVQGVQQELPKYFLSSFSSATNIWRAFENVFVGNDVYVLGYPVSIGDDSRSQIEYARPLLRKGIVSGRNTLKRTLIIDAAVYKGNSGGPGLFWSMIGKPFRPLGL